MRMAKSRVMIVDDAAVFRRLLAEVVNADPDLEVVAAAPNGRVALEKLETTAVDAVVLDVEMPELDGIATLKELRKRFPRLPVVMYSSLTERGAEATLDALSLGANDYCAKPNSPSLDASLAVVREQLVPKLKAFIAREAARSRSALFGRSAPARTSVTSTVAPRNPSVAAAPVELLVIAASTGGPDALLKLFAALPAELPVPVAVVQHMPPMFTRLLAERLAAQSRIPVSEAVEGRDLRHGEAIIAPGDFHLEVERRAGGFVARLHQAAPENSVRPAADVLFRSAAAAGGAGTLAVVLTGMGQDGKIGASAIVNAGGRVFAQDEATSVVWGMPGAVAKSGLAEAILPLGELAGAILRRLDFRRPGEPRP
jgi:two-component system chemotaxis response regulator CheB